MENEAGLATRQKAVLREIEAKRKLHDIETFGQKVRLIEGSDLTSLYYSGDRFFAVDIHGGGFCFKSVLDNDAYCAYLNKAFGCSVLNADFTLSQVAPFPRQIEDISLEIAALVARFPKNKDLPLIVVGHSSGANLAASLALRREGRPIKGLILDYPFLDLARDPSSRNALPDTFPDWLLEDWIELYCPNKKARLMPAVSPLLINAQEAKNFPLSVIVVATQDRLMDDGMALADLLTKAGTRHKLVVAEDRHGFVERNLQKIFSDPFDPAVMATKKTVDESFKYLISELKL
jgi:acetyl esterase/lipase